MKRGGKTEKMMRGGMAERPVGMKRGGKAAAKPMKRGGKTKKK